MKRFSLIVTLLSVSLVTIQAQEVIATDTIRSVLPVTLGDSTDLITAEQTARGNWFFSVSAGVNSIEAEANRKYDNIIERVRPTVQISAGKWVSPVWGLRFQMGIGNLAAHYYPFRFFNMYDDMPDHSIMPEEAKKYLSVKDGATWFHRKFMYTDFQFNIMTDVVRWFTREDKRVGLYLFAGPGFSHAFGSQGLSRNNSFAFKLGGQLDLKLSDKLSFIAELQGTIVDESFDGQIGGLSNEVNRTLEGYTSLTVGLTYKFGGKKFKRFVKVNPVELETIYYSLPVQAPEEVLPEEQEVDMFMPFTVRFFIDKHNIEEDQKLNIHKIAVYLQKHPSTSLRLSGHADKETANPSYNMKLSERRVKSVKAYIIKTYGIEPFRLQTVAKGDREKVYQEDYRWNRAVVMQIIKNE